MAKLTDAEKRKKCKEQDKVLNPETGRCVGKNTKKGKELLAKKSSKKTPLKSSKKSTSKSSKKSTSKSSKKSTSKSSKKSPRKSPSKSSKKSPRKSPSKSSKKSPRKSTSKSSKSGCFYPENCETNKSYKAGDIQDIAEECGIDILKKQGGKAKKSRKDLCNLIEKKSASKSPKKSPKRSASKSSKKSASKPSKKSPKKSASRKSPSKKSGKADKSMKVVELKDMAKAMGITGYYKLKKDELIEAINNFSKPGEDIFEETSEEMPEESEEETSEESEEESEEETPKKKLEKKQEPEEEESEEEMSEEDEEDEIPTQILEEEEIPTQILEEEEQDEISEEYSRLLEEGIIGGNFENMSDCSSTDHCDEDETCYIGKKGRGKCISSSSDISKDIRGNLKTFNHKGKKFIGSPEAIDILKSKFKPTKKSPKETKKINKDDIEELLEEMKEPIGDENLEKVQQQLYKCLGIM